MPASMASTTDLATFTQPTLVLGLNQHPRCGCVISSVQHLLHGRPILPPQTVGVRDGQVILAVQYP
jgi:hypothetical protein